MGAAPSQRERWWAAAGSSVVATALAVSVNLATDWKRNWYAWVAVAVLTLTTFLVTYAIPGRSGAIGVGATAKTVVSSRRKGGRSGAVSTVVAQGVVLELEETNPDGTRHQVRAYTEEAARLVVELRRIELTAGLERDGDLQ